MDLGRSLVKLTIASGCVLGGVVIPPILTGAGIGWGAVLATALGSIAAGNAANVIDSWCEGKGDKGISLQNRDLTKAVGKAIAAVITLAAKGYPNKKTGNNLEKIAAQAKNNWIKIAQQELTKQSYPQLREVNLDRFLTPEELQLTQEGNLGTEDWENIFRRLNMAACKGGGFKLPAEVYSEVAELLRTTFPKALRETLKEDFASDGKAFAGLTLQLLTGMKAELGELRNSNAGINVAELTQILEQFQQLETQLRGTVAEQQELFWQLSQEIDSGFAEVCQQLGVMETNITRLLQNLERRLDDLDEKLTRLEAQGGRQLSKRELRNRQKLLAEMRTEVESRLSQSLHNAVLLNLGKEQQPHQVERPWDVSVKVGEQRAFQLPSETGILEVFEDQAMGGKFLILGKPGGGKTTTLLELLRDLVDRAETYPDALIPVKLELSEWRAITKRKFPDFWKQEKYDPSIKDWILSQLRSLGIDQEIGEQWIRDKELILLLDGLDELPSPRQAECVRAINKFLESEFCPLHLVVCSRKEEYEDYEEKLLLNGAICLEDLTVEQMEGYFSSVNLGEFWESIRGSEKIVNFIRQPLFLAITSIAYQQIDIEEWQNCNTEERAIDYLLGIYRIQVLDSKTQNSYVSQILKALSKTIDTSTGFTFHDVDPLSFLQKFNKGSYWYFFITILDLPLIYFIGKFSWELGPFSGPWNLSVSGSGIEAIFSGVIILLRFIFALAFLVTIFAGTVVYVTLYFPGLPFYNILWFDANRNTFWINDKFTRQIKEANNKNPVSKIIIMILINFMVLIKALPSEVSGQNFTEMAWTSFKVLMALLVLFLFGLVPLIFFGWFFIISTMPLILIAWFHFFILIKIMENHNNISKSKVMTAVVTTFVVTVAGVLLSFLYFASIYIVNPNLLSIVLSASPMMSYAEESILTVSLSLALYYGIIWAGGLDLIKYCGFRLILGFSGIMPWNITRFLDYCTERLILQRVGNRYRFIHRLVQEHFANLEIQKD